MDQTAALDAVLLALGEDAALRAWLRSGLPDQSGTAMLAELPGPAACYASVADRAAELLVGRGLLNPALLASLTAALPARASEIAALGAGPAAPAPSASTSGLALLPRARDAFFGRQAELAQLSDRLASAALLTLVGPPGVGKSRLALEYGRRSGELWAGGIVYCDLANIDSLPALYVAVARSLGVALGTGDQGAELGAALASRGRCLVVLDGFARLVGVAAQALGRWIDMASQAVFLVTSAELLSLPGEVLVELAPLPVVPESMDLFVCRTQARKPDFQLCPQNSDDVRALVSLLDGMPLAIEVAAARGRTLSPREMVDRLQTGAENLDSADPGTRSVQAAYDVSWDLLTSWERAALASTSVFEGGFTLDAAEAVLDLSPWPTAPSVMDVISSLVNKSLVRSLETDASSDAPLMFSLYRPTQEFAASHLTSPDAESVQRRHIVFYAHLSEQRNAEVLDLALGNLVVATRRAVALGEPAAAISLAIAAAAAFERKGPRSAGVDLAGLVLAMPGVASTELEACRDRLLQPAVLGAVQK